MKAYMTVDCDHACMRFNTVHQSSIIVANVLYTDSIEGRSSGEYSNME